MSGYVFPVLWGAVCLFGIASWPLCVTELRRERRERNTP